MTGDQSGRPAIPESSGSAASTALVGEASPLITFVVKLRNLQTRSWGDQTEVSASSAQDAAEQMAGSPLVGGFGDRSDLRARVWAMPFGSKPDTAFYVDRSAAVSEDAAMAGSAG